ncbi:MAG: cytochrome b/b6 domain-containing protein [Moraxellaceae bacterium]|nr:cytochrome b/b6 domain-containing protein [Moraxellaceae bacterium]MDP1776451.1 cytochrome b/b6 domain-containing protein [Moraxellaceae bacterium]
MTSVGVRVWDLPLRLFHWALALLVVVALFTGDAAGEWLYWHRLAGLSILWLLVFRLSWGFCGPTYARFSQFAPTPAKLMTYFRGQWRGEGHSPLGALSVFALIFILLLQVSLGLFARDDTGFMGPLSSLISLSQAEQITDWHRLSANVVFLLVLLHISAIIYYRLFCQQSLVLPMITGVKKDSVAPATEGGGPKALIISVLLATIAVVAVLQAGAPKSAPSDAPPVVTPAW